MLTDPQDDVPCRGCETEGPRARLDDEGLCPDCRTPAGRLVTALAERGVKATANARGMVRPVGNFRRLACTPPADDGEVWEISGVEEYADDAIKDQADAIAAIVQAPGLRAERNTLAARVAALEAHNGRLRSALQQAKTAARFPDASDAWDQIRDAVSALDDLAGGAS